MLEEMTTRTVPALADANRHLNDAVTALRTGTPNVGEPRSATCTR
jgi:hypothetical protein